MLATQQQQRQLELVLTTPHKVDVDGMMDSKGVEFIGTATQQFNGMYHCLANVGGALCWVEVKITFPEENKG